MSNDNVMQIPVYTLATRPVVVPAMTDDGPMTPERLSELRTVLAALADAPLATLEVHPLPKEIDRKKGLPLDSASPLAHHLTQLITQAPKTAAAGAGGEVLYRMVVPAKVAAQVGNGLLRPMAAKAGGIHGALVGGSGIAAQARFVPVAGGAGAVGGAAAAGGAAAVVTVAAPLVLAAIAVAASVHAEQKRQAAIENITELLEKLHADNLELERAELDGCRRAIDNATAILLDEGKIGAALGLEPAVHAINTAFERAKRRLKKWTDALDALPDKPIELSKLHKAFGGIASEHGEFHAHLELANLAVALMERVIVLQAVEAAQSDPTNHFENFTRSLNRHAQEVNDIKAGLSSVLRRLSTLRVDRTHGVRDFVFSSAEVDKLLDTSYRLRALGQRAEPEGRHPDVAIDIVRSNDGSLVVLPGYAA
ncbi:hypothetical protein ACFQWH_09110 [Mycolicibacterium sp. GCM10028919]|uniref:hypothetical protein n=1 Tax=Mycolicibacterium sp. GCM10028919 TaxID=3273401 RepID=UPI003622A6E0